MKKEKKDPGANGNLYRHDNKAPQSQGVAITLSESRGVPAAWTLALALLLGAPRPSPPSAQLQWVHWETRCISGLAAGCPSPPLLLLVSSHGKVWVLQLSRWV